MTSLFVMQNAGFDLSLGTMITWLFVAVLAAIGNAGVPMGCYFLTLSLMSSLAHRSASWVSSCRSTRSST